MFTNILHKHILSYLRLTAGLSLHVSQLHRFLIYKTKKIQTEKASLKAEVLRFFTLLQSTNVHM